MVFVHLLPKLIGADNLHGGVAVMIDVLRASTMIVHALVAGCMEVIPVGDVEEARRLAAMLPPASAILAGERQGVPIDGFDLGNSPGECSPAVCQGKSMVITTTNGTRALLACLAAEEVVLGAFVNFAATCQRLLHEARPIHLVCAGTDGRISYEDTLLAGAFARHFKDLDHPMGNDEAEIAAGLWAKVEDSIWQKAGSTGEAEDAQPLARYLMRGRGGRRVVELGRDDDIAAAAWLNRPEYQIVAELKREPPRIVARH
jgi:2-phosphosulfolactate phosphatase